jgi:hypothetical protein
MTSIIFLPDQSDVGHFLANREPENVALFNFESEAEVTAFWTARNLAEKCSEHDIEDESDLYVEITLDGGEEQEFTFGTEAEKDAFKLGLELTTEFQTGMVLNPTDDGYDRLLEIANARAAS